MSTENTHGSEALDLLSAKPGTRTWDDGKRCAECCTHMRCDGDCTDRSRENCPHCLGTGWALWTAAGMYDYLVRYRRMTLPPTTPPPLAGEGGEAVADGKLSMTEKEAARKSAALIVSCADEYFAAVSALFKLRDDGPCLAERQPSKDTECLLAFQSLNDTGKRLREVVNKLHEIHAESTPTLAPSQGTAVTDEMVIAAIRAFHAAYPMIGISTGRRAGKTWFGMRAALEAALASPAVRDERKADSDRLASGDRLVALSIDEFSAFTTLVGLSADFEAAAEPHRDAIEESQCASEQSIFECFSEAWQAASKVVHRISIRQIMDVASHTLRTHQKVAAAGDET